VGVWGPRARDLVQGVSDDDWSNAAFPPYTAREVFVGYVPCLALRISYAGELGWEIYTPSEFGEALWDTLWEAGRALDAVPAGMAALDSLRLEKGYRLWGVDIHTEYTPWEAGLGFTVRLDKDDFLGRAALVAAKEKPLARKLCCLTFDDPAVAVLGKEVILDGEQVLGSVTSANYGYTVGKSIAYGYLPAAHAAVGTRVAVQYFGRDYAATVTREPLFDPKHERVRA
jgi:glycine cleavage system aminomethyltransferase T